MNNDKRLDNLESQLDVLEHKENTKFWVRIVGWSLLTLAVIVGTVVVVRMIDRLDKIDQRLEKHIDACVSDSVSALHHGDVYELVDKATQESLNTYIDSQGTFLTVLAALITGLVALIGIAFPLLTNKGLSDQLRKKINKQVNKQEKKLKEEISEEVKMQEKELIERLNTETEEKIKEAKKQIDEKITEIGTDAKSKSDKMGAEMESAKRRIEQIERDVTGIREDLRKRQENFDKNREIENKSPDEQVKEWKKMEEEDRADSDTYFNLGQYYFNKKDYVSASHYFGEAVKNRKNFAEVYPLWAEALEKQGLFDKAWEKLEKAIILNPNKEGQADKRDSLQQRIHTRTSSFEETLTIEVSGVNFSMKLVRNGIFLMGATAEQGYDTWFDEHPEHRVMLDDFYIGETLVTQALWKAVMGDNPSHFRGDDCPVESVSWNDVTQRFIPELNLKTGRQFRLPTEAEWEFAARGGNKSKGYKYSGSDNIDEVAWYWKNSGDHILEVTDGELNWAKNRDNNGKTHPVKRKKPNELGLYDMSGNVWEWCQDWLDEYSGDSQANPTGPKNGLIRVCRGGSWYFNAWYSRVAYRGSNNPEAHDISLGFRLVLDAIPQKEEKRS